MKNILSVLLIILIGVVFYGATVRGKVGNYTSVSELKTLDGTAQPFESSHERASYAEMLQLRQSNTVELSRDLRNFAAPDVGYFNDKYYSYFPPGISLFIRPFFELGFAYNLSLFAAFASISVLGILTMILIYLTCRNVFNLPSYLGIAAAIIFGFATTSWSYAVTIYQHVPTAFFAMVMFYGVSRYRARAKTGALWATAVWFTYGISILFDYPNGILLAPFILYYILSALEFDREEQKLNVKFNMAHLSVCIWFLIAIAIHVCFNALYMNNWYAVRQTYYRYDPSYKTTEAITKQAKAKITTVTTENAQPAFEERFHIPFLEEFFLGGLFTLLVAPDKGVFFFSPLLIFAMYGFYYAYRKYLNIELFIISFFVGLNLFLYASFPDPYGGWAFGPRYLIPSLTFLSIFTVYAFDKIRNFLVRGVFYMLFLVSLCISAAGALTSNKVPPLIEATYLKLPYYNFLLNFNLLDSQKTGSFVYNTFLKNSMNVSDLYVLIVFGLGIIMFCLLFIVPLLNRSQR